MDVSDSSASISINTRSGSLVLSVNDIVSWSTLNMRKSIRTDSSSGRKVVSNGKEGQLVKLRPFT